MKAGWKTTEFWLSLVAEALGFVMFAGIIETGTVWDKVIGGAMMVLAAMGYSLALEPCP